MLQRVGTYVGRTLTFLAVWAAVALVALLIGFEAARSPQRAIMLVGAAGIGWLALERKLAILVPVAVLALAWGSSNLPGTSIAFALKFGAIALISATVLPSLVSADRNHVPVPVAFGAGFLGLILFAIASVSWSVVPSATAQKAVSLLLIGGAVAVAIPLWAKDTGDLERLLRVMAVSAAAAVAVGLVLAVTHVIAGFENTGRFEGLLNSANATGYWMAPLFPCLVMMAAREVGARRRVIMLSLVAAVTLALLMSGSRAGSLAAVAGIGVGLFASGASGGIVQARRTFTVVVVAIAVALLALPGLSSGLRGDSASQEGFFEAGTGSGRSTAWPEALVVINQRPLQGHGLGATPVIFIEAQDLLKSGGNLLGRTHNSYLEAAIDLGWPGMLWLVLLALSGVVAALRVARRPGPDAAFATVLLAGIVGGVVEGVFESGLLAAGGLLCFPFWMVVAMAHVLLAKQAIEDRAATSTSRSLLPTT